MMNPPGTGDRIVLASAKVLAVPRFGQLDDVIVVVIPISRDKLKLFDLWEKDVSALSQSIDISDTSVSHPPLLTHV